MARNYRDYTIYKCDWPVGAHPGRWVVQTYGDRAKIPWADERCPHFSTLAAARAWIDQAAEEAALYAEAAT